jgi:hypothetical protein
MQKTKRITLEFKFTPLGIGMKNGSMKSRNIAMKMHIYTNKIKLNVSIDASIETRIHTLTTRRDTLLPKLLSGEVEV